MKKFSRIHLVYLAAVVISISAMSFKPATQNQSFLKSKLVALNNAQIGQNESDVAVTAAIVAATRAAVAYTSVVAEATAEAAAEACPELLLAAAILAEQRTEAKITTISSEKYDALVEKSKEADLDRK